jgi:hypothetical protein
MTTGRPFGLCWTGGEYRFENELLGASVPGEVLLLDVFNGGLVDIAKS